MHLGLVHSWTTNGLEELHGRLGWEGAQGLHLHRHRQHGNNEKPRKVPKSTGQSWELTLLQQPTSTDTEPPPALPTEGKHSKKMDARHLEKWPQASPHAKP